MLKSHGRLYSIVLGMFFVFLKLFVEEKLVYLN